MTIQRMKNRHLLIVLDDDTHVDLRPPNIEEWGMIVDIYEAADSKVRLSASTIDPTYVGTAKTAEDAAQALVNRATWGNTENIAPYAEALGDVIDLLSATRVDAKRLPMWAHRNLFGLLVSHWMQVQISIEGEAALPQPASPPAWVENENDPDGVPVIDLEQLAAVPPAQPDAPAADPVVSGLQAGKPTAAAH